MSDHKHPADLDRLDRLCESAGVDVRLHLGGYAEPGYSGDRIALADWNDRTRYNRETNSFDTIDDRPGRLAKILSDRYGFELEWSDEWTECGSCCKPIRSEPDSYHWTPSFARTDDFTPVCLECLKEDERLQEDVVEAALDGTHGISCPGIDLEALGFVEILSGLETGFHPGQDADPEKIGKQLEAKGIHRYLFRLDSTGQFDSSFSVWVDGEELENGDLDPSLIETDGPSISEALSRALKSIKIPSGPGVHVASVDVRSGTSTTRTLTPEEWVSGDWR